MKKLIALTVVLLASMAAMGCISYRDILPIANPTIAPTVSPSGLPPVTDTPNPEPSGALPLDFKEYGTGTPPNAHMANDVLVSHPTYYARDDLGMPLSPEKGLRPAHHGVIHMLEFWNSTDQNQTVDVSYFPSSFIERYDDEGRFVTAQEIFYDPSDGFFSTFVIGPHERRTVYVYAYIADEDFDRYHGQFTVGGMAITMVPRDY
jgi:hypothetical protein